MQKLGTKFLYMTVGGSPKKTRVQRTSDNTVRLVTKKDRSHHKYRDGDSDDHSYYGGGTRHHRHTSSHHHRRHRGSSSRSDMTSTHSHSHRHHGRGHHRRPDSRDDYDDGFEPASDSDSYFDDDEEEERYGGGSQQRPPPMMQPPPSSARPPFPPPPGGGGGGGVPPFAPPPPPPPPPPPHPDAAFHRDTPVPIHVRGGDYESSDTGLPRSSGKPTRRFSHVTMSKLQRTPRSRSHNHNHHHHHNHRTPRVGESASVYGAPPQDSYEAMRSFESEEYHQEPPMGTVPSQGIPPGPPQVPPQVPPQGPPQVPPQGPQGPPQGVPPGHQMPQGAQGFQCMPHPQGDPSWGHPGAAMGGGQRMPQPPHQGYYGGQNPIVVDGNVRGWDD